jgi:HlyD family secretion protein
MERAAKEVRRAQGNYERAGQNVHAGLELQDATLAYEQARLAYEIALDVDNHDLASAWSKVEGAQADLEALLAEPTEEEVEAAELSVQRAQLALERAQRQYDDATLSAPFDGTVTALTAVVGERVSGAVVVIVADLDALEVEITLDEGDVARVSEGQEALLTVEALEDVSISGEVLEIAPQGETKSGVVLYPVTVKLTERPERVRAGMTTDVEIVTERWENVLHLPQRAVQLEGDRAYLLVQGASGEFERVPVVLGRRVGGHVEILEGVNEGAVVGVLTAIEVEEGDDGTQMPGMNMLRRRF